jgi:hypothetical protein
MQALAPPTTYTAASVAMVTSLEPQFNWVALISIGIALVSLGINWYYKHKDSKRKDN